MNYWKQFAEMLGLELGEKFELIYDDGTINEATYKIEEDGFYYKNKQSEDWFAEPSTTVNKLISGYCKAVPKPWKPENGDEYWRCSSKRGFVSSAIWLDDVIDLCGWKSGNCFRTKEEAETKGKEIMEKLVKEYKEA